MITTQHNLALKFEDVVKRCPNNLALKYTDSSSNFTYGELNTLANKLANYLRDSGIGKGQLVAIINTKLPISFALMIACLKIGAAYANIDEETPLIRLEKILLTCQPAALYCDIEVSKQLEVLGSNLNVPLFELASVRKKYESYPSKNLIFSRAVTGADLAYIMFTSGSTGSPKGVAVSHDNVLSFINWSVAKFNITSRDVFANPSPIYFDNSVFDIFSSLFSGASLAPFPKSITKKPFDMVNLVDELQCSIWFSVPSLLIYINTFKALSAKSFKKVRVISFGGEGYPLKELKKIYDKYSDRIRFVNVYGPTEGTCICSSHDVIEDDFNNVDGILPIGTINENFDYLILSSDGKEVVVKGIGELCLLGPNVAVGYYNDKTRTQAAFVRNPLQSNFYEKMYKTGDLVFKSFTTDELNFVGRKDNQIKHMGYRIELEEIEYAINSLPYVIQGAVIYKRINDIFGKLYAFVLTEKLMSQNDILMELKHLLPKYMLPNEVVFMSEMPRNQNGKIDRLQLKNQLSEVNPSI
jgi:D-alanine--poly(phosphoribitol) ligase subunit 1